MNMKKEEMVNLHMLLVQVKKYCEENCSDCDFTEYNELGISPFQVHRSEEEHKQAVFVLGAELVSMTAKIHFSKNKETLERMQE